MNDSKVPFALSFAALTLSIVVWDEMFSFTKSATNFPDLAHLLTLTSLTPVIFFTPINRRIIQKTLTVALLVPALVIAISNWESVQILSETAIELMWVSLVYTVPVTIFLGILRLIIFIVSRE